MKLLMKQWKKTSKVFKAIVLLLVGVFLYMFLFRKNGMENFGNPKSCTYYYMNKCGHCTKFTPEWDAFVNAYSGPVKMRKVEMNVAGEDLKKYKIDGFPTVLIIDEDGETQVYDGARTKDGLMDYFSN